MIRTSTQKTEKIYASVTLPPSLGINISLTSVNWFGDCQGKDAYRSAAIFLGAPRFLEWNSVTFSSA
jgi:hypothetical protein